LLRFHVKTKVAHHSLSLKTNMHKCTSTADTLHFKFQSQHSKCNNKRCQSVNFFNALINALLTHPGPSRRRVGGKLPQALRRLVAPPVEYRKLESK